MHMQIYLKDLNTGQLVMEGYFTTPELVKKARVEMEAEGSWHHIPVISGVELPYFFMEDNCPMYVLKHVNGLTWGEWGKSPGGVLRKFKCSAEYTDARAGVGYADLVDPKLWVVIDQCGRPYYPGRDYNFRTVLTRQYKTNMGGKWGIVVRWSGYEYLVLNAQRKGWSPSINGLRRFANGSDAVRKVKNGKFVPLPGLIVVERKDDGTIIDWPEIDLFM